MFRVSFAKNVLILSNPDSIKNFEFWSFNHHQQVFFTNRKKINIIALIYLNNQYKTYYH